MDVILMSKNKILDISKNKSLESKREETTSKSSISLEPIQRKFQDFQTSDGLHMIDIIKGIEYYGKTTKFKNLRQSISPPRPINLNSQRALNDRVLNLKRIKGQIGKPIDTKLVIESQRQYHDTVKKKANKFFNVDSNTNKAT